MRSHTHLTNIVFGWIGNQAHNKPCVPSWHWQMTRLLHQKKYRVHAQQPSYIAASVVKWGHDLTRYSLQAYSQSMTVCNAILQHLCSF